MIGSTQCYPKPVLTLPEAPDSNPPQSLAEESVVNLWCPTRSLKAATRVKVKAVLTLPPLPFGLLRADRIFWLQPRRELRTDPFANTDASFKNMKDGCSTAEDA